MAHLVKRDSRPRAAAGGGTNVAPARGMRIHRIPGVGANSYLIETAEALFLVDGGLTGNGSRILNRIERIGRKPEDLAFALVTHAHADHFGGLAAVQKASGCAIACHPAHVETIRTGGRLVSPGLCFRARLFERVAGFALRRIGLPRLHDVFHVEDGATLHRFGLPGRVTHTPGHSTGDLILVLDDGSAFVGDLVQGPRPLAGRPAEFSVMAVDEPAMLAGWSLLLDSGAKTLFPGHGAVVAIDDILPAFRRAASLRLAESAASLS